MKSFLSIVRSAVVTALFFGGAMVLWNPVEPPVAVTISVVEKEMPVPELDPMPVAEEAPEEPVAPEPVEIVKEEPEPPRKMAPLPFVMNISPFEGGLMLQGSVPSKEIKNAVVRAVAESSEKREVFNRLKFSPQTEHPDWLPYLPEMVKVFFSHTAGEHEMTIVDGRLILDGNVREEKSKAGLLALTGMFSENGLKVETDLSIDGKLKSSLPEFPDEGAVLAVVKPERETEDTPEIASTEKSVERDRSFHGPFVGPPTPAPDEPELYVSLSPSEESGPESEEVKKQVTRKEKSAPTDPIPDDGKPLIFYFGTGSSTISPDDEEKIQRAIQRASIPRSIVYITAYADYRGSFQLNRKLSAARAETVRDAIFSGDIAEEVKAEITAKADAQSEQRNVGKRVDDESLRRSRRVVVEVYHLR